MEERCTPQYRTPLSTRMGTVLQDIAAHASVSARALSMFHIIYLFGLTSMESDCLPYKAIWVVILEVMCQEANQVE